MATNGKRNRQAGHSWELEVVADLRPLFPHVATSRNCSRLRDAQKIDLANTDELKYGRLPYNIQCKSYSTSLQYGKLLDTMPDDEGVINVVLHKQTEKSGPTGKFMTRGKYAIMHYEDFLYLIHQIHGTTAITTTSGESGGTVQ